MKRAGLRTILSLLVETGIFTQVIINTIHVKKHSNPKKQPSVLEGQLNRLHLMSVNCAWKIECPVTGRGAGLLTSAWNVHRKQEWQG